MANVQLAACTTSQQETHQSLQHLQCQLQGKTRSDCSDVSAHLCKRKYHIKSKKRRELAVLVVYGYDLTGVFHWLT